MSEAIRDEDRRLIIVVVEHGMEPGIEYEGTFAPWEAIAALNEAAWLISQTEEEEMEAEKGE